MTKKKSRSYYTYSRKAERELDEFLARINRSSQSSVLSELRELAD